MANQLNDAKESWYCCNLVSKIVTFRANLGHVNCVLWPDTCTCMRVSCCLQDLKFIICSMTCWPYRPSSPRLSTKPHHDIKPKHMRSKQTYSGCGDPINLCTCGGTCRFNVRQLAIKVGTRQHFAPQMTLQSGSALDIGTRGYTYYYRWLSNRNVIGIKSFMNGLLIQHWLTAHVYDRWIHTTSTGILIE